MISLGIGGLRFGGVGGFGGKGLVVAGWLVGWLAG